MIKRKIIASCAIFALAAPAIAGEITGRGASTPVQSGTAGSVCAFSGLNDDPGLDGFGKIQSYGQLVRSMGGFDPTFFMHPGNAC